MKKLGLLILAVVLPVAGSVATAAGDREANKFRASLDGYQEVVGPGSISTTGEGKFSARLHEASQTITYTLTYTVESTGSVAHIHFAQRHVGGGVIAFLCGGGDKPPCPPTSGTVTGTIDAADVIGPAGQGIEAGSFEELVRAMRAGATYVNVHSTRWPSGEIRGQIRGGGDDNDDDD